MVFEETQVIRGLLLQICLKMMQYKIYQKLFQPATDEGLQKASAGCL